MAFSLYGFLTLMAFITGDFFELQCQCRQYAQNRNKQKSHLSRNFRFASPRMSHYTHVQYAGSGQLVAFSGQ